jgi:hypothetical protein
VNERNSLAVFQYLIAAVTEDALFGAIAVLTFFWLCRTTDFFGSGRGQFACTNIPKYIT